MKLSITSMTRNLNDNRRISCRLGAVFLLFSGAMKGQSLICRMQI